jgi:DNA-binding MarR family transcriptional regulator
MRIDAVDGVLGEFIEGLFRLMLEDHLASVVEIDLTLVQAQALRLLRAAPLSTSGLAAALGISAPAVTQLTDRLMRKNLIERQTVKTDRRAVIVAVTEKGGRAVDGFRRRRSEIFANTLSRLSDVDRMEVIAALGKVAAVLHGRELLQREGGTTEGLPSDRREAETEAQTKVDPPAASNGRDQVPARRPTRRMRIEWD